MKTIEGGAIGCRVTNPAASAGVPSSKGCCKHAALEPDIRPSCEYVHISAEMYMQSNVRIRNV